MDKRNIESIYPLTPMQQSLLFHHLQAGQADQGFLHLRCTLSGKLQIGALEQAWRNVVASHSALRTSIHEEGLEQHLQVVHRRVTLRWEQIDWTSQSAADQSTLLESFLEADRVRGFDFSQAPIFRLTLLRLEQDTFMLVWSCHHILLDGWSGAIVLQEVFERYRCLCRREEFRVAAVRPYRDYTSWLRRLDLSDAEDFWRNRLRGFLQPTPLPTVAKGSNPNGASRQTYSEHVTLSREATSSLERFVHTHKLTLYTALQGAWALLLSQYSDSQDVVFGSTVSGRPPTLEGADRMVGLFMNSVPIRASIPPGQLLRSPSFQGLLPEKSIVPGCKGKLRRSRDANPNWGAACPLRTKPVAEVPDILTEFIVNELLSGRDGTTIDDDANLLMSGQIDSIGMMRLIDFIEERFDFQVPPEDVTIENFMSVRTMSTYIARQAETSGSA